MVSISTLGQSLDQIDSLKTLQRDLATLQTQLTTGKKSQTFGGLGVDSVQSIRSRADFSRIDGYLNNIKTANRRMNLMTSSLTQISDQTERFQNAFANQTQQGDIELSSIASLSRNVKTFVTDLINTKDEDRFLFGGADTQTKPLSDTGALDSYVATRIQEWIDGTITSDELINSYTDRDELNDTIVGYSPVIASGQQQSITVRVQDSTEIDYTVKANNDAFRDVVVVSTIMNQLEAALDKIALDDGDNPADFATAPGANADEKNDNFFAVFTDLSKKLNTALDGLNSEIYKVSQAQAQIADVKDSHKRQQNILLDQVDNIENVDINEVAVKLNSLSVQLQASYSVTASISQLTLANFI